MMRRARVSTPVAWLLAALLVVGAVIGSIGSATGTAYAADGDTTYAVPRNATQAWVDVESASADAAGVSGTLGTNALEFKASPSGVTAVADAAGLADHRAALTLQAKTAVNDALVAVTFADANGVILAEYATKTTLGTSGEPVTPGNPSTPGQPQTPGNPVQPRPGTLAAPGNPQTPGTKLLGRTGATVLAVVAVMAAAAIAGVAVTMIARRNGNHAPHTEGGAR